jgi:hypothetical protein
MAEEELPEDAGPAGAPQGGAAAWSLLGAASREKADAFLEQQIALTGIQIRQLAQVEHFEHSHLRWRRFNDQMKGALQIMAVLIGAVIVLGLAVAAWNASRVEGLVVEAFAVPPQLAATGLTGDVVADELTNRVIAIRNVADANSVGHSGDVRQDSEQDIKVEIPQTGISVAEAWRILRAWLGHERHVRGSLRLAGDGRITLALNGEDAASFTGPLANLGQLEQQAAEHVYEHADESNAANYVVYLGTSGHIVEAEALAGRYAQAATRNRADWYSLWAQYNFIAGHAAIARARMRLALAMDPRIATTHLVTLLMEHSFGHEEEALRQSRLVAGLKDSDQPHYEQGTGFQDMQGIAASVAARDTGDFLGPGCPGRYARAVLRAFCLAGAHDPGQGRTLIAEALSAGTPAADDLHMAYHAVDADAGDWTNAVGEARAYQTALAHSEPATGALHTQAEPLLAGALAHTGDFGAAHRAIDATPADCYFCLLTRADIDVLGGNRNGAAYWFARAVSAAPSLPFAYAHWGRMLLAKGEVEGAIAKFQTAHAAGPHFADPLELWGEALMAQNRSDLALAKFAEAARYAPNWGRLHLKWGEALIYAGKKDAAQAQFALAADLTAAEKAELARHG